MEAFQEAELRLTLADLRRLLQAGLDEEIFPIHRKQQIKSVRICRTRGAKYVVKLRLEARK